MWIMARLDLDWSGWDPVLIVACVRLEILVGESWSKDGTIDRWRVGLN